MKNVGLAVIFFFACIPFMQGQENNFPKNTITESDRQYFMPYSTGIKEKSLIVAPDVARIKPSQVSLLKKKLNSCLSLFYGDSLFNPMNGLKATFKQEILSMDGINEQVRWIPSSFEINLFTTLSKDSLPYWESTPDAFIAIYFNNPKKLVGEPVIDDIYIEPLEINSFSHWKELDRISVPERVFVAKRNNLPCFEPVSREDFILTLITFFQGSIEKAEKHPVSSSRQQGIASQSNKEHHQKFAEELGKIRKYDPQLADKLMQSYIESVTLSGNVPDRENGNRVDNNIMLNTWREAVRKLKAELNAMSSIELKSQAWWSNTEEANVSGLTPPEFSGSRPLVRLNKNLIDKTKPNSSIQLIVSEWSMLPGSDFNDITGYGLSFYKISQLGKDENLWRQVYNLLDN